MIALVLLAIIYLTPSCSSGNSVGTGEQQSSSIKVAPVQGELLFLDSQGQKRETFYAASGDNVDLPIQLTKGQISEFSVGYSEKHPQLELRSGRVFVSSAAAGAYHVSVVARNRQACVDSKVGNCEIDNRQVSKVFPQVDLLTSVVIKVLNPADLNPTGVGQGGGFMGQVLRGEGLIGTLAKTFMGGGLLGGAAGAGQPAAGTNQQQTPVR